MEYEFVHSEIHFLHITFLFTFTYRYFFLHLLASVKDI